MLTGRIVAFSRRHRLAMSCVVSVWAGVIFAFSSVSGAVVPTDLPFWRLLERKGAHVFEYFVLCLLAFHWLRLHIPDIRFRGSVFLSGTLSLLYAFSDELHQCFVFGREGKFSDVGIDAIGIILAMIAVGIMKRKRHDRYYPPRNRYE